MKHFRAILITCLFFTNTLQAQQPDTLLVHFIYNHSEITPQASGTIDSFLQANEKQYTLYKIELYGHCDFIGSHRYNDSLSLARVASARQYMLMKNVSPAVLMQTNGFGKRQPLNSNTNEEERLLNRRVEIIVYKTSSVLPNTVKAIIEVPVLPEPRSVTDFIKDSTTTVGSTLTLKNIHFQGGRHFLMPISDITLRELHAVMRDNPSLKIEIQGHVCCTIDPDGYDYDLRSHDLSVQRAKFIFETLAKAGIKKSRMRYTGFGSSKKLFPVEANEREKLLNRRVEIKILAK